MNLIGGYQHHHHHHLMHEPFPFVQRCHQDAPYFQSWVVNHGEVPADFQIQAPYTPSAELGAHGAAHDGRLEGLQPGMGKRRASGPKKERRRTESINTAFAELRECIPNVPADTKLSKIKTLRLATSYIAYLMDVLAKDSGETEGFKAEIKKFETRDLKRKRELVTHLTNPRHLSTTLRNQMTSLFRYLSTCIYQTQHFPRLEFNCILLSFVL
uniref:Heart- and neural crest derivatives-expressed protein 1 n=1 Tax=Poecilia reticulata TaxID=8081 RepID=A0A3P9PFX9_POERE